MKRRPHAHLTFQALDAWGTDDAATRLGLRQALAGPCQECLSVLAAYLEQGEPPASALASTDYCGLWNRLTSQLPAARNEVARAGRLYDELALLNPAERRQRICSGDEDFAHPAFVEHLLDAARATRFAHPRASLSWAGDALAALDRDAESCRDQRVLALALQANAHRALDDFRAASQGFANARSLAGDPDELDLDTLAELDRLEVSLLTDCGHFAKAQRLLNRALDIYRDLGQCTETAQTLLQLGFLFSNAGDLEAAIEPYAAALRLLSHKTEPRLFLAARFNLAQTLYELGQTVLADDLLGWDRNLYPLVADDPIAIRRTWLQARIARDIGEPAEAEVLFDQVREVFASQGSGFDAALVSLDLALLYQQQGRMSDVLAIVTEAVNVFSAHAMHREGLAALIMLRDAVRQHTATTDTIERVSTFLRGAARDPTARFQPPS